MKLLYLSLLPIFLFGYDISININSIKSKKGNIHIALYKNKENFTNTSKYFKAYIKQIDNYSLKHTFKNIPKGKYALSVFHDQNLNKKLDKNIFGIPKESYGFSNNPNKTFSKPTFDKCSFKLTEDKNISIIMEY